MNAVLAKIVRTIRNLERWISQHLADAAGISVAHRTLNTRSLLHAFRRLSAVALTIGCERAGSTVPASSTLSIESAPGNPCGYSDTDWCSSSSGDPCGQHTNEASCRGDVRCKGMPYLGESVVACQDDGKGFWSNCPAVGCISK